MPNLIKYIGIIILILVAIFAIFKFANINSKSSNNEEPKVESKVFEDPETIIYQVKGKEKFTLTKEDEEYSEILNKLNSSLGDEKDITKWRQIIIR